MDLKSIEATWKAFQEVQEKKLSAKQKKHFDKDNDGDIDDEDMKALNKEEAPADPVKQAPARKGDKKDSKTACEDTLLSAVADVLMGESKEKQTKGATEGEGIADKESPKSKEFMDMHKKSEKDIEDKEEQGHKDVTKVTDKTPTAKDRGGDQLSNGDKKTPTVAKEDVDQFVESLTEEQLDELSKNLLRRYKKKADAQTTNHMSKIDQRDPKNPKGPSSASTANFKKRMTGSGRADDKIKGKYAKVPATDANKGKR
jgi:hypothetical protein